MFIDTHGHVNFNAFREDSSEVLQRTLEGHVWVVMPGSQYSTSKRAVEMAEKYEQGVYAAVGLHPIHIGEQRKVDVLEVQSEEKAEQPWETFETRSEEFNYEEYKKLAQSKKVVAIGEIGLDYYYFPKSKVKREEIKRKQKETLRQQMDLADEMHLPALPDPREVISSIPLDRIALETDSPYLLPPMALTERNEPLFVKYMAEEI